MKLLFWPSVALSAAGLALFAVSNRESVTVALWPLPFVLELPLYLAILAALAGGFVVGILAAWVTARGRRREIRRRGRRIAALEAELAAAQSRTVGTASRQPSPLARPN